MLFRRLLAIAALLTLAAPAQAQLSRSFTSATYTGVGASQVKTDFDNLGKAYNLDAIGGYNIVPAQPWGRISAELNLGVTVSPGKNDGSGGGVGGGGLLGGGGTAAEGNNTQTADDLQTFIFSLQGVYRSPGRLYGIGSVGFGLINTSIPEIEESGRTSFNFGGGIGFKFGEETAAVEVLYSRVSSDLQTIGLRFIY
ncbi:MAG: outer membrane beta-barrel protein [Pseudomonadota bacterium]